MDTSYIFKNSFTQYCDFKTGAAAILCFASLTAFVLGIISQSGGLQSFKKVSAALSTISGLLLLIEGAVILKIKCAKSSSQGQLETQKARLKTEEARFFVKEQYLSMFKDMLENESPGQFFVSQESDGKWLYTKPKYGLQEITRAEFSKNNYSIYKATYTELSLGTEYCH